MISGNEGSASRAHCGMSWLLLSASQITRTKRSMSRRRGAVACAYGAPMAAWVTIAGSSPSKGV
ncbi:hypothetical protein D3C73_1672330 [compost metagenome]